MRKVLLIASLLSGFLSVSAQWSELGGVNSSFNGVIKSIIADKLGNIYAAGYFTNAASYIYVAKWDGTNWSELGGTNLTVFSDPITSLVIDSNNNIYAGDIAGNIHKWNGVSWNLIGALNNRIYTMLCDASNNLYAGGAFKNTAYNYYVAKWDGINWSELGGDSIFNGPITALGKDIYGNIYSGGFFYHQPSSYNQFIAKWDGSKWITQGPAALPGNGEPVCIYGDAFGNVYAGGYSFNPAGGTPLPRYFEKYDGNNWQVMTTFNSKINTITTDEFNNIYAAGDFLILAGNIRYVSKFDGNSWSELGGVNSLSANSEIYSILSLNGNIYAAGAFTNANGKQYVAKYGPILPKLTGYIFIDDNSNGIKDGNDTYKANVKVQLSNGNYTFTDNNGYYQIQTDSIGSYTLTVTPPTGYNALPQTVSYTFTKYDTTVTKDIALQQITTFDSLSVSAVPMVFNAVQGGAMPYWVQYENCGTSVLSPTVYLNYSNYILNYDSCSDINAIATFNGIATAQTNMQPGQMNNFIAYYDVKPTATIGDTLKTVYGISIGTAIAATDSFYMLVEGGSTGADGQRATPSLTAAQVAAGKDIYYTINFKNTGVDTAFNVVITDTLSSLLQANTLQMLSSSHKCKTTVKGNLVTFELLNIKLPKASTNVLRCLGFVSFKVKPKANLTAGTIITNKANTYYNYRLPISSSATTIIKAVVTPVQFTMYDVRFTNGGVMGGFVANTWTTATETNTSHFNVQRSLNGKDFTTLAAVPTKGLGNYEFIDNQLPITHDQLTLYYRLEIVDKDGSKTYSEVKNVELGIRNLGLSVYPNPAKDAVTINCKGMREARVMDCWGRVVFQSTVNSHLLTMNTKQLPKGVYMVQVITNKSEVKIAKLLVE